jgi:HSP20 family protein
MDRLWETVMTAPWRPFRYFERARPIPPMDVFEKEGKLHVRAELPGMTEKDVEITVTGDSLTITGEKKEEREVKEENYYRSERSYGKFMRQVALPAGADADNATARFREGVLEVEVPLKGAPGAKKVAIKNGA